MKLHIKVKGRASSQLSNALTLLNKDPDVKSELEVYSPKMMGSNIGSTIDNCNLHLSKVYNHLNGLVEECLSQGASVIITGETILGSVDADSYIKHVCNAIDATVKDSLFIIDKESINGEALSDDVRSELCIDTYSDRFYVRYPANGI